MAIDAEPHFQGVTLLQQALLLIMPLYVSIIFLANEDMMCPKYILFKSRRDVLFKGYYSPIQL